MKHISILFTAVIMIFLFSCKTSNEGISNIDSTSLKKNELIGTILYKEGRRVQKGQEAEKKELYFNVNNKDYFIKLSEGEPKGVSTVISSVFSKPSIW